MAKMKLMNDDGTGNQAGFKQIDSSSLSRPTSLPRKNYTLVAIAMIITLVVGGICLNAFLSNVVFGAENQQKEIDAYLDRDVSLDLPVMSEYVTLSNKAIKKKLKEDGHTIINNSSAEDKKAKGFDYYKIPSDVTKERAKPVIERGLSRASSVTLAEYLPGTWRMLMDRSEGTQLKLRYADFSANAPNTAISNAIEAQGFGKKKTGDITQDSAGNFVLSGTVKIKGKTYYWTISSCDLDSAYRVSGMPENVQYVSIALRK